MGVQNIYDKLLQAIGNVYGVCGLMGNLKAESGLKANNLQNSGNTKLNMTDAEYTQAVDEYIKGNLENVPKGFDFVFDSKGYGLAQWTYWSRKRNLINYAIQRSPFKSIGDEDMQVQFLIEELKGYKGVWQSLVGAQSIKEASNVVLTQYERPANQSDKVKILRAQYGQQLYNELCKEDIMKTRKAVVDLIQSWHGKNEADGSFKSIVDIYNSQSSFPRGTKMQYNWAWCACTWSALAVKLGYQDIMPIEISCYYLIEKAKAMGIWKEQDSYVPKPGDAVLYDWDDNGAGDDTGTPEHVGTVTFVSGNTFTVEEGNYSNAVKTRTMSINGRYIRGFICPRYDESSETIQPVQPSGASIETVAKQVIAGQWGNGTDRKANLEAKGYNYNEVQQKVNEILNGTASKPSAPTQTSTKEVTATDYATRQSSSIAGSYKTTADLYMRNGVGTNKKALVCIPKGTTVNCYGYYSTYNGVKWLYIQVTLDGVKYTGFSCGSYLRK